MKLNGKKYILDLSLPGVGQLFEFERIILERKTKYQHVLIAELKSFGKALFLDGVIQSTQRFEFIYHEALVHPALITHPKPEKILVIGGGEGATIREVLKHNTVKRCVMVDIDKELVEIAMRYLPEFHRGSFYDKRVKLEYMDGGRFIEQCKEKFDVIILDLVDPFRGSPAEHLYSEEFYKKCFERLTSDGILVTQAVTPIFAPEIHRSIYLSLKRVFPIVRPYYTFTPSYLTLWGFILSSKKHDPLSLGMEELERRIKLRGLNGKLKYYEASIHKILFKIPKYIGEILKL